MKEKIILLIIGCISILLIKTNVYAEDSIKIISIETIDSEIKGNAEEISPPTYNNLNININAKFYDIGDSIKYKIKIQNNSNKRYELGLETPFSDTEYIKYYIDYDKDKVLLEKNDITELYILVKYEREVPKTEFVSSIKKITNQVSLVIEKPNNLINPQTSRNIFYIILILVIVGVFLFRIKYQIKFKNYIWIIIPFIIITTVYANDKILITITPNIEIEEKYLLSLVKGRNFSKEINGEIVNFKINEEISNIYNKKYKRDEKIYLSPEELVEITGQAFQYEVDKEVDYCIIPNSKGARLDYNNYFLNDNSNYIDEGIFKQKYNYSYDGSSMAQLLYYSYEDIDISLNEIINSFNSSIEDPRITRLLETMENANTADKVKIYIKMPPYDLNFIVTYGPACI